MRGAEPERDGRWAFGARYIQGQIDRATLRTTLTYRVVPRLSLGLEWNPLDSDLSPLANWLAVEETEIRPALMLGTSSDRIGTPSGQSWYFTLSKSLERWIHLPVAPYIGAAYGTYDQKLRVIGGGNINFPKNASALIIYDGVHVHPTVSWTWKRNTFSFLLVELRHPGLAYSLAFDTPGGGRRKPRTANQPFLRPGARR